jgi:hypothetical protein
MDCLTLNKTLLLFSVTLILRCSTTEESPLSAITEYNSNTIQKKSY